MNRRAQLIAAWCGPAICLIFGIGSVALGRFIPPHISPHTGLLATQGVLIHEAGRIRIGLTLMMIAMSLMPCWGMAVAVQLRRSEGGYPVLTWIQIASVGAGTALACSGIVVWGAGTFRAAGLSPQFARFAVDLGWHFYIWAWPPFSVWAIAMGMAILGASEEAGEAVFPRWSAFVCFWTAFLFIPATGVTFFHHGPFGYNGLLALYVVMSAFFMWILTTTMLTIRAVKSGRYQAAGTLPPAPLADEQRATSANGRPEAEPVVVMR